MYQVSEGLPALLTRCLLWIEEEQWIDMDRLEQQEEFARLVTNYVIKSLLAPSNLFRTRRTDSTERHVVEMVLRGLVRTGCSWRSMSVTTCEGERWFVCSA